MLGLRADVFLKRCSIIHWSVSCLCELRAFLPDCVDIMADWQCPESQRPKTRLDRPLQRLTVIVAGRDFSTDVLCSYYLGAEREKIL